MESRQRTRRSDPETSREAADHMERTGKAKTHKMMCLAVVQEKPGLTAAEIAVEAGLERHEASRRLPNLRDEDHSVYNGAARECTVVGNRSMTWYPCLAGQGKLALGR